MDLASVAEWSRYVVGVALFVYLGAWMALISEMGLRVRLRRERAQRAGQPVLQLAVGAEAGTGAKVTAGGQVPADQQVSAGEHTAEQSSGDLETLADAKGRLGRGLLMWATVALAVGVAMRGVGAGRAPWGNMHEFSITASLVASVVFLVMARSVVGRAISAWGSLLIFITLGLAVTAIYVPPGELMPALRSYWLVVHVGCAVIAFGLFTVAAVVNVLQIMAERAERKGSAGSFTALLPESSMLDRLGYRLAAIGFPIWTVGPLILGAIWAEVSWGRYWGWDPKEVWALVTWLVYAAYLHARTTAGWKGSKASTVALVGYGTAVFSYFGVNLLFEGLHVYGM